MKWQKLALNPQALEVLYEDVPELENVELFSVELDFHRSSIGIRFDLTKFPERPSKRWIPEANTAQVKLAFWLIANFEAKGWSPNVRVKIDIEQSEELVKVVLSNQEMESVLSFSCEMFRIESITAYQNLK